MMFYRKPLANALLVSSILGLAACGGSSSGSGRLSLSVTDAPVDNANQVVVEFTGVTIKPAEGEAVEFDFEEPKSINLLDLQGTLSESLIDETVAAGEYSWIRLHVNADRDGKLDSFIEFDDGNQLELYVPSGSQTGLKLVSGFTVPVGSNADFTIDFDLRKSITNPVGMQNAVILKPALRIVDNTVVGSIAGSIDATLVSEQCADATLDDGAVYVYSGTDATTADVQGAATDPLVTALVSFSEGNYQYEAGFLPEGSYTIAYTCDAGSDDPEQENTLSFVGTTNLDVTADTETTHNF